MAQYGEDPKSVREAFIERPCLALVCCNGPHGAKFHWRRGDIQLVRQVIEENTEVFSDFEDCAQKDPS
jgi:hypothetical protein